MFLAMKHCLSRGYFVSLASNWPGFGSWQQLMPKSLRSLTVVISCRVTKVDVLQAFNSRGRASNRARDSKKRHESIFDQTQNDAAQIPSSSDATLYQSKMAANYTLFMTPEESERVQRTVRDRVQKCQEQNGQPRDPSDRKALVEQAVSSSLMQDMTSAAFGLGPPKSSQETMVAYPVGRPYPPSTTGLDKLQAMKLSDLRMETHHHGRVLSLRRVSPVVELKASSWAVVQGDSGDEVERLEIFLHRSSRGQDILDSGSEFLVKEPYYTLSNQGEPTIRIDHPSDLVISRYSHDPQEWRQTEASAKPDANPPAECKEQGNLALQEKRYSQARTHYTEGLQRLRGQGDAESSALLKDLHRNRAHVNNLLQCYDEAKADALASLIRGKDANQKSLDAKAYYRAGVAAYGLGNFKEAQSFFEQQLKLEPENQNAKMNLRRIDLRLQEEATGAYDLNKIIGALSKTRGRADVASFFGHTKVKISPGAGRGLFATRDIEPNETIMFEKAFCVVWSHEPEAFSVLTCDLRDDAMIRVYPAGLHRSVVQKLLDNPSQAGRALELFGDYKGLGEKLVRCDGAPVVDTFQIHDIVQRNAFGTGKQTKDEDVSNASTGLWIRAAYLNHSCVSNSKKDFVGDLMILRAARRIAAGEEITHSYDETIDYDARVAALQKTWGFKCKCPLCVAEEADGPDLRKKRQELEDEANAFAIKETAPQAKRMTIVRGRRLRNALNDTYDEARYEGLPRRAMLGIERWLQLAPSR